MIAANEPRPLGPRARAVIIPDTIFPPCTATLATADCTIADAPVFAPTNRRTSVFKLVSPSHLLRLVRQYKSASWCIVPRTCLTTFDGNSHNNSSADQAQSHAEPFHPFLRHDKKIFIWRIAYTRLPSVLSRGARNEGVAKLLRFPAHGSRTCEHHDCTALHHILTARPARSEFSLLDYVHLPSDCNIKIKEPDRARYGTLIES